MDKKFGYGVDEAIVAALWFIFILVCLGIVKGIEIVGDFVW